MTLFQRIIAREVAAEILLEDDATIAFRDIHPQAPVHILVAPRVPLPRLSAAGPEHLEVLGRCLDTARRVALQEGLSSYRIVINDGDDAGQTVPHLHIHVLGGRRFNWPPG